MHSETFGDVVNYDTGAYVQPLGDGAAIAVTMVRLAVDDIPFTDFEHGRGQDHLRSIAGSRGERLGVGAPRHLCPADSDRLRLGGNLKMIRKSVGDYSCYGLGFDVGSEARRVAGHDAGVNIQDATTTFLSWDTKEREHIMPDGEGRRRLRGPIASMDGRVVLAADADFRFENRLLADSSTSVRSRPTRTTGPSSCIATWLGAGRPRDGTAHRRSGLSLGGFAVEYAFGKHEHLDSSTGCRRPTASRPEDPAYGGAALRGKDTPDAGAPAIALRERTSTGSGRSRSTRPVWPRHALVAAAALLGAG